MVQAVCDDTLNGIGKIDVFKVFGLTGQNYTVILDPNEPRISQRIDDLLAEEGMSLCAFDDQIHQRIWEMSDHEAMSDQTRNR